VGWVGAGIRRNLECVCEIEKSDIEDQVWDV